MPDHCDNRKAPVPCLSWDNSEMPSQLYSPQDHWELLQQVHYNAPSASHFMLPSALTALLEIMQECTYKSASQRFFFPWKPNLRQLPDAVLGTRLWNEIFEAGSLTSWRLVVGVQIAVSMQCSCENFTVVKEPSVSFAGPSAKLKCGAPYSKINQERNAAKVSKI